MTQVFLTDEQANTVRHANDTVALCDQGGGFIGYVKTDIGFTADEIDEAEKRAHSEGPWYTTAEVLSYLRTLEQE